MGTQPDELAAYYAKKYPFTFTDDFSQTDPSLTERYKPGRLLPELQPS
ncbi:hypothetical protein [Neomoorella glycerini]|nr:hypothetical protein [Moorella glycerini]